MRTPPFLLGATLLFWGWQTGFYTAGIVMALVLEGARLVQGRWEFSDEDFSRIWTFCAVLFLAAAVYAFTANEGPSRLGTFFQNPRPATQTAASRAGVATVASLFRWLPMIFFLFVAAQVYSAREEIPLHAISLIMRRRWKRAEQMGRPLPRRRGVNVSMPFYVICLFSASYHAADVPGFFWGFCVLLAWALWTRRSPRFHPAVWLGMLVIATALGYVSQRGVIQLQAYLGTINPQWLFSGLRRGDFDALRNRTSLGRTGRLRQSGQIVIRLEPVVGGAPTYLQEASYRIFKSPSWLVSNTNEVMEGIAETPRGSGTWQLIPGKTNFAEVNVSCYLEGRSEQTGYPAGLLPLPPGSGRLQDLPVYVLQRNSMGAVMAEGPGVVSFDACYGPGQTIDSPPDTNEDGDLQVPPREQPALDRVIAELDLKSKTPDQQMRAISAYFQTHFRYTLRQVRPRWRRGRSTPLTRFLLRTHSGHCEYFATATVLLLRELGIPARYAVGYAVHEHSGRGYVVRARDAHAWCLVWDSRTRTWRNFDTTPSTWIQDEASRASAWQWFQDVWSWIRFQIAMFRWGQSPLRPYLLLTLAPALVVLLYQVFYRRGRRLRSGAKAAERRVDQPGLDSEFYLIERKLSERGVARQPYEPLSDWVRRATSETDLAPMRRPLDDLLHLHYRCRFDPQGLNLDARRRLRRGTEALLNRLEQQD